jgi:HK97 family phage major capsid protein
MDPKTLQTLIDSRERAINELRELATAAESRAYSADEAQKEANLSAAITDFDNRIRNGVAAIASERSMAEAIAQAGGFLPGREEKRESAVDTDLDVLHKMVRGEVREHEFKPTADELTELRATGVSKAGPPSAQQPGIILPTLYTGVYQALRDLTAVVAANATIMRTDGYQPITMPMVSGHVAASIVGEGAAIGESDPQFQGNVTWTSFKYAFITTLTQEVLNDAAFDLVGWLSTDAGQAFSNGIGTDLLTGNGTTAPQGLITGATSGLTLANKAAIASDELFDLFHSVKIGYRQNAVWIANDSSVKALRKLKDSTGNYIWQSGLTAGSPDTILGKPVITDQGVPVLGAINTKGVLGFGDVNRAYVVRYAGGLRVDRSTDFRFTTDEIAFRFIQRADGRTRDAAAFQVATTPAT